MLARTDCVSVGIARQRWSVEPMDPGAPLTWYNVSGAMSRQFLGTLSTPTR